MKMEYPCKTEVKELLNELKTADGEHRERLLNQLETKINQIMTLIFHDERMSDLEKNQLIQKLNKKLVKHLQADMLPKTMLALSVVSGFAQIASGGATGSSVWLGDTAKLAGKALGAGGQGVGAFNQIATGFKDATVAGSQYTLENSKQKSETAKEAAAHEQQERDRQEQAKRQLIDSRHGAFQEMARG